MYAYVYHMPQTKAMSWEGGCLEWKKIVDHIDEEKKEHEKDQPNHFFPGVSLPWARPTPLVV